MITLEAIGYACFALAGCTVFLVITCAVLALPRAARAPAPERVTPAPLPRPGRLTPHPADTDTLYLLGREIEEMIAAYPHHPR